MVIAYTVFTMDLLCTWQMWKNVEKANTGKKQIGMHMERINPGSRWKTLLSRNVVVTFPARAYTSLPTIYGSTLPHPTYVLIVKEELLIPSRSLPGYLQCNDTEWAVQADSFWREPLWSVVSSNLPGQITRTTLHKWSHSSPSAVNTVVHLEFEMSTR